MRIPRSAAEPRIVYNTFLLGLEMLPPEEALERLPAAVACIAPGFSWLYRGDEVRREYLAVWESHAVLDIERAIKVTGGVGEGKSRPGVARGYRPALGSPPPPSNLSPRQASLASKASRARVPAADAHGLARVAVIPPSAKGLVAGNLRRQERKRAQQQQEVGRFAPDSGLSVSRGSTGG